MLKSGLLWVTTLHGNLTHLIFVQPLSVVNNYVEDVLQTVCRAPGKSAISEHNGMAAILITSTLS